METLTLQELNCMVRNNIRQQFPETYWVQAEVSECKAHFSGHCYLELIQRKTDQQAICAKARATIWASTWAVLGPYFESQTGSRLMAGQQILAEVSVEFHELYGFNLVIKNIDPSYTLGNQAMRRLEILRRLEEEGVIDQNKELEWPALPQRIAIISSPAAAGYQDFIHQLEEFAGGLTFYTALFPAVMQGEESAPSIIEALDHIIATGVDFDVVVIIRGGGAVADLSCFDEYDLCYYCTQFPIPILSGLGHDKDHSVLDRVAHTSVKTPTAAAEYLIDSLSQQAFRLDSAADRLIKLAGQVLDMNKLTLQTMPGRLMSLVQQRLHAQSIQSERIQSRLKQLTAETIMQSSQQTAMLSTKLSLQSQAMMERQKWRLQLLEKSINSFSPETILKKGFPLSVYNGKVVRSVQEIPVGGTLETRLTDGILTSTINKKYVNDEH